MENLEHLTEDHHFKIRETIQSELIRAFYGIKTAATVTNEQAYTWIRANAADFDAAFKKVVDGHPSFWDDAQHDLTTAVQLVEEYMKLEKMHQGK